MWCNFLNVFWSLTLKKVLKTYEFEKARSTTAKNVLNPPFHTAGPISRMVARARSVRAKKNFNIPEETCYTNISAIIPHASKY